MQTMGTEAPTTIVIPVHCAPKKAPCPKCGIRGRRKRTVDRTVRTVAYKAIALLEITYGEYEARCACCGVEGGGAGQECRRRPARPGRRLGVGPPPPHKPKKKKAPPPLFLER